MLAQAAPPAERDAAYSEVMSLLEAQKPDLRAVLLHVLTARIASRDMHGVVDFFSKCSSYLRSQNLYLYERKLSDLRSAPASPPARSSLRFLPSQPLLDRGMSSIPMGLSNLVSEILIAGEFGAILSTLPDLLNSLVDQADSEPDREVPWARMADVNLERERRKASFERFGLSPHDEWTTTFQEMAVNAPTTFRDRVFAFAGSLSPSALVFAFGTVNQATDLVERWKAVARASSELKELNELKKEKLLSDKIHVLARHLNFDQLDMALALARGISDPELKARALVSLVEWLAPVQQEEVLVEIVELTRGLASESAVADLLSALYPIMTEKVLLDSFERSRRVKDEDDVLITMALIDANRPSRERHSGLNLWIEKIGAVRDETLRAEGLVALAPHLARSRSAVAALLAAIATLKDKRNLFWGLLGIIPHVDPFKAQLLAKEAIGLTGSFDSDKSRSEALSRLATLLPSSVLPDALTAVKMIVDPRWRAAPLFAIATQLPVPDRTSAVAEAVATVASIQQSRRRAETRR